jgi:hypothetical protein
MASSENGSGGQSIEGIHDRGEDEQELWKRSEGEGDELRDLKGENPSFFSEFYCSTISTLISQRVQCNRKRMSQKGPMGRPGGQEVWPADHNLPPKILGFSQNSLINYSIHSYP